MPKYKGPRDAARALLARGIRLDIDQPNASEIVGENIAGTSVQSGVGPPPGYISEDGDAELLARMIFSEAAGQAHAPALYEALGWTAVNRIGGKGFEDRKNLHDVIMQENAFGTTTDLWDRSENTATLEPGNKAAYEKALHTARRILNGQVKDPTRGATYFYSSLDGSPPEGFFVDKTRAGILGRTRDDIMYGTEKKPGQFTFMWDQR